MRKVEINYEALVKLLGENELLKQKIDVLEHIRYRMDDSNALSKVVRKQLEKLIK